ncbi:ABC transporter ATP-binding protein [Haloarculaceae archaeon H-GB2-1]|nr:ABC transporter ATP-binding protein [Haloarculaceae archaeon H-GB1-1]MEA5386569.1 ABC transporter ATP-binding protein [Haloarculaceae archaeon H-GB11]MEA5408087.1 ABC transporter ATP-binding protein [Haloarculaceae archaeon H-GB2-1]
MSHIQLDDLRKRFGDVEAVRGIDLEIEKGEFLVLVGPSGCGKSTTLRMLAGLEDISEGELRIADERVNGVAPKNRNVAMVFQNYALYPHMTAAENMKFGMKSAGDYGDDEIERRLDRAADILDIPELMERKPGELSGGERQRVAIGRALVREPEVFLLDEPLSNLDAKLRVQMRAELLKLHQELQTTTVYVTHDQTEAMTLGDRVAVLDAGQLQQVAEPQELYDFPANRFVAEFIGNPAMNLVPVDVVEDGGEVRAEHEGFSVGLPDQAGLDDAVGQSAHFGIRPEDVSLAGNLPADAPTHEITVSVTEPLGESLLMHCDVGGDEIQVKAEPRAEIRPGDDIEVGFDEERLHLFDQSGDAVYHSTSATPKTSEAPLTE